MPADVRGQLHQIKICHSRGVPATHIQSMLECIENRTLSPEVAHGAPGLSFFEYEAFFFAYAAQFHS